MLGWLERRRERRLHNDLDVECRYWWGDRAGSMQARCYICRLASAEGQWFAGTWRPARDKS